MIEEKVPTGSILDVRLFGSTVRGDSDGASDIDILVVTNSGKPDTQLLESDLSIQFNSSVDLSIYSFSRLQSMFNEGHLFAWHLYQESLHLDYRDTTDSLMLLGMPQPYKSARGDVSELIDLLKTIKNEVTISRNLTFEAGLLYVSARNIALSASWCSRDGIKFGRNSPYEIKAGNLAFPLSRTDYDTLVACRHASTRGKIVPTPSRSWLAERASLCHQWAIEANDWMMECERVNQTPIS